MDDINKKVNIICREFVKTYDNIERIVSEFDEDDTNCFFFGERWFDKHKLSQLLNFLKVLNPASLSQIHIYRVLDGRYGYCPDYRKKDLVIHVENPIKRSAFWVEPECHSPSGGNYMNTRADIKITNN